METRPVLPVFLHVPRAGGTTIREALELRYKPTEILTHDNSVDLTGFYKKLTTHDLKKLKLVMGHLPFGIDMAFHGHKLSYFTFLRDPVSRVLSDYWWTRKSTLHVAHKLCQKPLLEALDARTYRNFDNLQVRMFSNSIDVPYGQLTADHLKHALEALFALDFVGNNTFLKEGCVALEKLYRWDGLVQSLKNQNVNPHPLPTEEEVEAIKEHNRLDVELFRSYWAPEYMI